MRRVGHPPASRATEPLTQWYCEACGRSGVVDAREMYVYEATLLLLAAHAGADAACEERTRLTRVRVVPSARRRR